MTISKKRTLEKASLNTVNFPTDYVEIDTKIISGLVDGFMSVKTALDMLRNFYDYGVRDMLFTYTISDGNFNNHSDLHLAWFENLKNIANQNNQLKNLNLNLSAVYLLDDRFDEVFDTACRDAIQNKWIFIQFPLSGDFIKNKKWIAELRQCGYNPILTHSEKDRLLNNDLAQFFELRSTGCRFHIGMDSLFHEEENSQKIIAHWLIRNQMVNFIGTNFSSPKQFENLHSLSNLHLENLLHPLFLKNSLLKEKRNESVPF